MIIMFLFRATEIGRTGSASRHFIDLFERQSSIDSEASNGHKPVLFLLNFSTDQRYLFLDFIRWSNTV